MRIFLDAGHGGRNAGVKRGSLIEKDYTLKMVGDIKKALSHLYGNVHSSRSEDDYLMLSERFDKCAQHGADVCVCIHVNAAHDQSLSGLMCFHVSHEGAVLGDEIMRSAPSMLRRKKQKSILASKGDWTNRAYNCISGYDCPSVLVECFFATNEKDFEFGQSRIGRRGIVSSIVNGISNYESNLFERGFLKVKSDLLYDCSLEYGGSIRG